MPPHADYTLVLGLVISFLDPRERALLASVNCACAELVRSPCPCAAARVTLPPPPGSAPHTWLATHRPDTLVISKRMRAPTTEFMDCVRQVAEAVTASPPRRLEISCPFVADTRGVCDVAGQLLRAGVRELAVSAPGALPPQEPVELRLDAATGSVELELDVDELRLSGSTRDLRRLSLSNSRMLRVLRMPDGGLPALTSLTLGCNMRLREVVPHPGDAPLLARLRVPDVDVHDLHVPVTALSMIAPCRLADYSGSNGVRELEVDMWHRRSDECAFSSLVTWPRLHTLVLRNVRRLSALDDMVSWSITGLPPSLRCVRAQVPVDDAVDPPRDIQRYFTRLMGVFRLQCACTLV